MREQTGNDHLRSHYKGPRAERNIREKDNDAVHVKKTERVKNTGHIKRTGNVKRRVTYPKRVLLSEGEVERFLESDHHGDNSEYTGPGRQIKVESIGKTLGIDKSEDHNSEKVDRSDFGRSRRKTGGKRGNKKKNPAIKDSYKREKSDKRNIYDKEVDLIFGEDLTKGTTGRNSYESTGFRSIDSKSNLNHGSGSDSTVDQDRTRVFINTRQSNYSGARSERMQQSQERRETEERFSDVRSYLEEDEEEERLQRRSRWKLLLMAIGLFFVIYEIIMITLVTLKPQSGDKARSVMLQLQGAVTDKTESKDDETSDTEGETSEAATEAAAEESSEPETLTEETTTHVNESGAVFVENPVMTVEAGAIGVSEFEPVELMFSGDVYLSDHVMEAYQASGDITGVVSQAYLDEMKSADYFVANEEFPFSNRGTPEKDKQYTFEVDPSKVDMIKEMGIDLVTLANNHTLDFGPDALLDTLDTLDKAGISHVGAGKNIEEAAEPVMVSIKGRKIAFIGATRVMPEAYWAAGESSPGLLAAYDPSNLIEEIKQAKEQADLVVVYVHWGEERKEMPNEIQTTLAHDIVDAGADLVVGAHPHVLQGIEYYKDVPIVYSLGNFVFGSSIPRTALLRVTIDNTEDGSENLKLRLIPGKSSAGYTRTLSEAADKAEFYSYMESISKGISIGEDGTVSKS